MADLGLIFTLLLVSTLTGCLPGLWLPDWIRGKFLAVPVLGFGLFGVFATLLYQAGLSPQVSLYLVPAISLALALGLGSRPRLRLNREHLGFAGVWCGAVLVALIPKWIGGEQFYAFQLNPWDQLGYLSEAVAYSQHSYSYLYHLSNSQDPVLLYGQHELSARPTIAIILAAVDKLFGPTLMSFSYTYLVFLQVSSLIAGTFLIVNVFSANLCRAALVSGGIAIGFCGQYVLDIDAWSELGSLPIALVGYCLLIVCKDPSRLEVSGQLEVLGKWVALDAIIFTSLMFFYPEIVMVYGIGFLIVTINSLSYLSGETGRLLVGSLLLSLAITGILLALSYEGTLGFFVGQFKYSAAGPKEAWLTNFSSYNQYLIGKDLLSWDPDPATYPQQIRLFGLSSLIYGLFSLPINVFMSVVGLGYLLLDNSYPLLLRVSQKLVLYGLVYYWLRSIFREIKLAIKTRSPHSPRGFYLGLMGMSLIPIALTISGGRIWFVGKSLSMIMPLICIAMASPLWGSPRRDNLGPERFGRLIAAAFVALSISLAIMRAASVDPQTGWFAGSYPVYVINGEDRQAKLNYSWQLGTLVPQLKACSRVAVDISNPDNQSGHLARYVELYLDDLGITWFSIPRTHTLSHRLGKDLGFHPPLPHPQCLITDHPEPPQFPGQQVFSLRRAGA